jgi:gamma-glutamyltranspeptidase/glutathione hydrolase
MRQHVPAWVQDELQRKGYAVEKSRLTSGPITAIFFDRQHGTLWGGASDCGEDYGIGW